MPLGVCGSTLPAHRGSSGDASRRSLSLSDVSSSGADGIDSIAPRAVTVVDRLARRMTGQVSGRLDRSLDYHKLLFGSILRHESRVNGQAADSSTSLMHSCRAYVFPNLPGLRGAETGLLGTAYAGRSLSLGVALCRIGQGRFISYSSPSNPLYESLSDIGCQRSLDRELSMGVAKKSVLARCFVIGQAVCLFAAIGVSLVPVLSKTYPFWGCSCFRLDRDRYFRVTDVVPGSPASLAGLVNNDSLLSIDGKPMVHA
jgi:hypothetical protein